MSAGSRIRRPVIDSEAESQTVIGFTEAELGLVIATVFMVLWVMSLQTTPMVDVGKPPVPMVSEDSAARLRSRIAMLEANVNSLKGKRSIAIPSCAEKHLTPGPIFAVRVVGSDAFVIDDSTRTWAKLMAMSAEARAAAHNTGCRHQVSATPDPSSSGPTYHAGLRRLRTVFYTLLNGRR